MLLLAVLLAMPVADETPPFLLTLYDTTNSHFAQQSLQKDVPPAIKKAVPHPEIARVEFGPEVTSAQEAAGFAGRAQARYYVFAQCGLVIELLKQCDAHIKYCAHSCEAWLYQTEGNKQIAHQKVTGEKGGTDAVKKLLAQLPNLLEPLKPQIDQLVAQRKAEQEARAQAEKIRKQLEVAEKERKLAEERARKAALAEEQRREKERRAHETAEERAAREKREREEKAQREASARAAREAEAAAARAKAEEERLRKESEAATKKLEAERQKRVAIERAQASRVINLRPGQTVAVLEVENDLTGGARNQVNTQAFTDALRRRVSKSGLGLLVMDRDAIFQILAANEKAVLECQANCETHLGKILKSDYVISGRLGKQGNAFRLYLLMYRSGDGALLSDASATSPDLASLDKGAAIASTDLLSVFPMPR